MRRVTGNPKSLPFSRSHPRTRLRQYHCLVPEIRLIGLTEVPHPSDEWRTNSQKTRHGTRKICSVRPSESPGMTLMYNWQYDGRSMDSCDSEEYPIFLDHRLNHFLKDPKSALSMGKRANGNLGIRILHATKGVSQSETLSRWRTEGFDREKILS